MDTTQQIIEIAKYKGIVRAADIEAAGISRNHLYRLCREGVLSRSARGLYILPNAVLSEHTALAEIAKRAPRAVVCLLSALNFHGITTQLPHETWIALPRGAWHPRVDYPQINLTYMSEEAFSFGREEHSLIGVSVKIFTPAKTVADCFKFRNKVGLDVAIEALRETWRSRKATMDELLEAAKVCRASAVMRPYMEALV